MKHQFAVLSLGLLLTACSTTTIVDGQSSVTEPTVTQPLAATPQDVTIIGVNDFHGNLLPTSFKIPDPKDSTKQVAVKAGGIDTIGGILAQARQDNPNTIFVGVGDMTGASPLVSALLRDEPTIKALSDLGMEVNVVGNHEFDNGFKELQRFQKGGCDSNEPTRACKFENFTGAKYTYIAANVVDEAGQHVLPAYKIVTSGKAKIAFVGAVLKDTPTVVSPAGVAGLKFEDEVAAVNRVMPEIKNQHPDAIIALIHQGGASKDSYDAIDCKTLSGDIVKVAQGLDPDISVIMSGHTHKAYNCLVADPNGKMRTVIQGDAYGHLLQRLDLNVDTANHKLLSLKTRNVLVDSEKLPKDSAMTALMDKAKTMTDPMAKQVVATLGSEQITRTQNAAGESALGNLIADSQLAAASSPATGSAVIAFMNPGGIRADLPAVVPNPSKVVTYGDVFTVQPFGNIMQVETLTGAQIKTILEQQFDNSAAGQKRMLSVSQGFSYTWDASKPKGDKVSNMLLNGKPIDPAASYRVTMNNFLADGGDGFTEFAKGTNRMGGAVDLDAFQNYLKANANITAPATNRITRLN